MLPYYEYRHVVAFDETNVVGNVYFAHFIRWQGRCREMFLREQAPTVLADIRADLKLFTLHVDCEFLAEVAVFDEIAIRMRLVELAQTQVQLGFDYVRLSDGGESAVARGRQRIACMRGPNGHTEPARVPPDLVRALAPYARTAVAHLV